jgi:signal transduction histidine kinase
MAGGSVNIQFHAEGNWEHVDATTTSILYRIIQECIHNALKHAQAGMIDIALHMEPEGISVTIEDDGKGFDPDNPGAGSGIGLQNMRARVEYLKGSLEFQSAPGKGTLVAIFIPTAKQ